MMTRLGRTDVGIGDGALGRTTIDNMDDALEVVAPGTDLRLALDMVLAGHIGALVCLGDVESVVALGSGGFDIDTAFTPNRLFELAKMDGALVIDAAAQRILRANFHLTPTVSFDTKETGMRHRTAIRMSVQTEALLITVSQRRSVIDLYLKGESVTLDAQRRMFTQADVTLLAMQSARDMLDHEIERLSYFADPTGTYTD